MGRLVNIESTKLLLRSVLMADAGVAALVGNRVWGAHFQDSDGKTVTYPMVIIDFRAGSVGPNGVYELIIMDLYAYGRKSAGFALELYQACYEALQNATLRKDGIPVAGYCVESIRPLEGWNENVRAYFVQGQYQLRLSTREI